MTTVQYLPDWTSSQSGPIHAGERLEIDYAAERLRTCRAKYRGQDAWNIGAYVRFHPGGEEVSGAVAKAPLVVDVPADATRIELWFHNTDNTGCSVWDSRYCQNHWLEVEPALVPA